MLLSTISYNCVNVCLQGEDERFHAMARKGEHQNSVPRQVAGAVPLHGGDFELSCKSELNYAVLSISKSEYNNFIS